MDPVEQILLSYGDVEFAHSGVKGMKWGITRRRTSRGNYVTISDDAASARALLAKPASSASNTEIQAALNRMRLETQFREMQTSMIPPSRGTKVKTFVGKLLADVGREQVTRISKTAASVAVENAMIGKKSSGKDFAKVVGERMAPKPSKKKKEAD